MKLIKKSEALQQKKDASQKVEVKPIDRRVAQAEKPDVIQIGNRSTRAYMLGKVAGSIASFLIGFFKSEKYFGAAGTGNSLYKKNRKPMSRTKGQTKRRGWNG